MSSTLIMKKFLIQPPFVASSLLILLLAVASLGANASVLVANDKNTIGSPEDSSTTTTTASHNAVRTRTRNRIRHGGDGQQRRGLLYDSVMSYPRNEERVQPHQYRRDLKGSSSSSSSYDASSSRCSKFLVVLKKADIVANQVDLEFGYTLQVDLYNGVTAAAANNKNNNNNKAKNNKLASSNTNTGITDAFDGAGRRNLKNFLSRNNKKKNKKKKMNIAKKMMTGEAVAARQATRASKKLGSWYESIVYTDPFVNSDGEAEFSGKSGFGNVMVTFNKNTALSLAAALDQKQYPITGGSGAYAKCPGGYAMKLNESATTVTIQFNVCKTC